MVHHVRSPKQPALMADAVIPVVGEIVGEEECEPGPRACRVEFEERKSVHEAEDPKYHRFADEIHYNIPNPHEETGRGVLKMVQLSAHEGVKDRLDGDQREEERDGEMDQVRHRVCLSVLRE